MCFYSSHRLSPAGVILKLLTNLMQKQGFRKVSLESSHKFGLKKLKFRSETDGLRKLLETSMVGKSIMNSELMSTILPIDFSPLIN